LKAHDFVLLYKSDSLIQHVSEGLRAFAQPGKPTEGTSSRGSVHLKNLFGSLDAVLFSAVLSGKSNYLVILHDREEASYFLNDLQNLLGREILFFPMSYKRPYEYDEIENANVLMRSETLSRVSSHPDGNIIVTYPEALCEKVITKKSLTSNIFSVTKGEVLDRNFLEEFLHLYHFEKTDFVFEAGQFAIRGGILDVFSFANDLPFRIELFGDEVDSIRTFDPGSQLSVENLDKINLMPDLQTRLVHEERQSLFEFLPNPIVWIKDVELGKNIIQKSYEKATARFEKNFYNSGNAKIALEPAHLFEDGSSFVHQLEKHRCIEFGQRHFFPSQKTFDFNSKVQPSFNKNFELLAQDLMEHRQQGFANFIAAEQPKQAERLQGIFEEIHPDLNFQTLAFPLRQGFVDVQQKIVCYTDHQIFERFHRYRGKEKFSKSKALTLRELQALQAGDFVTHIDYGIGKFAGLEKKEVNGIEQEAIRLVFRDDDLLYVSIHALHKISKYTGREGSPPSISKLGSGEWDSKKAKVRKKVKDIAKELIDLYAKRKQSPGYAFGNDTFLQAELETSFIYEDTPDQAKATEDVKKDMQQPHPMDRLVCGDVGFGKTEVAIRAAFKATTEGKQVAVLVPTTILAMQHWRTFSERLSQFPVTIEYISRFKSDKEIKAILGRVKSGHINIIIGTHRVVSKDVEFHDLGLLIVDEEQKFGVKTKDRLKEIKVNVDVLTLTATPIPRTLHFSLMGARDLSIISTPPPNRQPVSTELHPFDELKIRDAVSHELARGGQVFFVHNRVSDIEQVANLIFKLVPDSRIGIAHGQMDGDRLEKVMIKFIEGEYDVLVSTNIIESGLDIPNANTIIINNAHLFGLSDLHQMRGRVGRSNKKAFCFLFTPPASVLSSDSRKRLAALEEFSDLGDGFKVAMRDLDIRGAGNLLGAEQSGFITDLGFDTYHKILDEAIQELKETVYKDLFAEELLAKAKLIVPDCVIETDLEILIPDNYISNTTERLKLYASLDNLKTEEELTSFSNELIDRFGNYPEPVLQLINSVRLRWMGEKLGMEKINLKGGKMRIYFISGNEAYVKSEIFGKVLAYIQRHSKICRMKDSSGKLTLTVENILSIRDANTFMEGINL